MNGSVIVMGFLGKNIAVFLLCIMLIYQYTEAQTFADVTDSAGLAMLHNANKMSTGIAVADFDNNGWPDLFYTGYFYDSKLYFNQGDGTFLENPSFSIPDMTDAKCGSVAAADYDNDGWQDIYVACNGNNFLLHNNQGQGFSNVINSSATNHSTRTEAVSWGDLNNDGWLDLVVAAQPDSSPPDLSNANNLDHFFINNQDGTFSDIYTSFPQEEIARTTLALILLDIDFDNDLDLYFANDKHQENVLYRNDGPGCNGWCFTNIGPVTGADYSAYCMGVASSDYDHDGDWDFSYSSIDEHILLQNQRSQGSNTFVEVATTAGTNFNTGYGWGTVFFDADNDAWEDLFVGLTGGAGEAASNYFFHNNQNGSFTDLTNVTNLTDTNPTQAVAWLDYNRDGKLDLTYGHYNIKYKLHKNTTVNTNNWIAFTLEGGANVNRDAIGTKVFINTTDGEQQIKELRSGESRGSNNQLLLHFGTGNKPEVTVSVHWPNGLVQDLGEMTTNQYTHLKYPLQDIIFSANFE